MPFGKGNYFFKKILKKKKYFFFFEIFEKKSTPAPKKALLLPNLAKKTPKTNPRPKCIGGFHHRRNLQKIVSMPFGKGNYFFKRILKKKKYFFFFFFFFFFFGLFETKKHSCSQKKHSCSQIWPKKRQRQIQDQNTQEVFTIEKISKKLSACLLGKVIMFLKRF